MVKDAEAHAAEDQSRKEEAEVRNQADTLVYQTEKLLREHAEKIDDTDREQVEQAVSGVKDALAGSDVEKIKAATEGLMVASQKFSQQIYEATANAAQTSEYNDNNEGDEIVDAEIVDDEK
jgi:molecular chaperone DnaK